MTAPAGRSRLNASTDVRALASELRNERWRRPLRLLRRLPVPVAPARIAPLADGSPTLAALSHPLLWQGVFVGAVVALDTVAFVAALRLGHTQPLLTVTGELGTQPHGPVLAAATLAWISTIFLSRGYDPRQFGAGTDEYRRVANAAARFIALLALALLVADSELTAGTVAVVLPAAAALTLTGRFLARRLLHVLRGRGLASHRVIVIGEDAGRDSLVRRLNASAHSGLRVVGVCAPPLDVPDDPGYDVDEALADLRATVDLFRADTVAVAHSPGITPILLRRIAWVLEGSGANLLVAPGLTDVAGPRVNVQPVAGVPLLQIAEGGFSRAAALFKRAVDVAGSAALLLLLLPVMAVTALAIRSTWPGPVLVREPRLGLGGRTFQMFRFRTPPEPGEGSPPSGTPGEALGVFLRRRTLDELPQLVNVLRGDMSLVGPRPPRPDELDSPAKDVMRRLLVKPGVTGLCQVSGRSTLDWPELLRLELYYVENRSLALDAEILFRTAAVVLKGVGGR